MVEKDEQGPYMDVVGGDGAICRLRYFDQYDHANASWAERIGVEKFPVDKAGRSVKHGAPIDSGKKFAVGEIDAIAEATGGSDPNKVKSWVGKLMPTTI